MNISPLSQGSPITRLQGSKASPKTDGPQDAGQPRDTVEISDMARYLAAVKQLPDVRQDRVDQARQAIADGTMDTPEKLDAALGRLFDETA